MRTTRRQGMFWLMAAILLGCVASAQAVVLRSDLGATLAHETGTGSDILGGALKQNDSSTNTLYFKFHVDPLSDVGTKEYFAAFQLYEGDVERLGVGNSLKAWAYSAPNTTTNGEFNKVFGDLDLRSSQPESSSPGVFLPNELPRRGIGRTREHAAIQILYRQRWLGERQLRRQPEVHLAVNPRGQPGAAGLLF